MHNKKDQNKTLNFETIVKVYSWKTTFAKTDWYLKVISLGAGMAFVNMKTIRRQKKTKAFSKKHTVVKIR